MRVFLVLILLFSSLSIFATTTYTVGATGDFTTISAAYTACSGSTDYILNIQNDYNYSTESSAGTVSISLGALSNKSEANTVTIRPATGVTLSFSGTVSSIFVLNGASWVIFDGRAGGLGSSAFTLINSSSSSSKRVFTFMNDASNNIIKYCLVKGDNSSISSGAAGLVLFSTTTGSTGNDSNTIDHCTFQQNSSNPGCIIQSTGTSAKTNSGNNITNNNFVNFTCNAIWADTYTTGFTITGNSFYQTASITPVDEFKMISLYDGGGYTITGNYFGGRSANCGGAAFVITNTTNEVYLVYFAATCSGSTNTISANTFSNLNITTAYTTTTRVTMLTANGTSDFIVGSSGNGNVIGATSGTGNITITDNAASGIRSLVIFNMVNTATTNSVCYNTVGSLSVGGTNTTGEIYLVRAYGLATNITIDHNTFGNTTANNMSFTSDLSHQWITDNGGGGANTITVTNNTFQNFNITSTATLTIAGIYNILTDCILVATGNTFKNITTKTQGFHYFIAHGDYFTGLASIATISSNNFQDLSLGKSSNTNYYFYPIYIQSSSAVVCNSNIVGSSSSNNIVFAGDVYSFGIYKDGTGDFTADGNYVQQFNLTNTTSGNYFSGIEIVSGKATLTNNVIRNITSPSTSTVPIIGIEINSTTNSQVIRHNTISGLSATTSNEVTSYLFGILIGSSAGSSTISKNIITTLTNTKIGELGQISGIYSLATTSGVDYFNNVIILSNGAYTNFTDIAGIGHEAKGSSKIYHNTISISGTSSHANLSAAFMDFATTGSVRIVKNNIFQNKRTGFGAHLAIYANNKSGTTFDYNYEEVLNNSGQIGFTGTDGDQSFASWKTNNSSSHDKNTSISINSSTGYVAAGSSSDVKNTGVNLSVSVSDDLSGLARSVTPWMGAYDAATSLPISLLEFYGVKENENSNRLYWSTATEHNNDYFTVERTTSGDFNDVIGHVNGAGISNSVLNYSLLDTNPEKKINYYRLRQTDFDGKYSYSDLISIDNTLAIFSNKEIVNKVNILGQEINENYRGLVITTFSDGSSIKTIQ